MEYRRSPAERKGSWVRVEAWRHERKYTMEQMADWLGISAPTYRNYELRKREPDEVCADMIHQLTGVRVPFRTPEKLSKIRRDAARILIANMAKQGRNHQGGQWQDQLELWRLQRGYTRKIAAEMLGITYHMYVNVIRRKGSRIMSYATALRIQRVTGVMPKTPIPPEWSTANTIGRVIHLRIRMGYTKAELAEKMGVWHSGMCNYEGGKYKTPHDNFAEWACLAMGFNPSILKQDEEPYIDEDKEAKMREDHREKLRNANPK